jgi:hypothetical protein
MWLDLVPPPAEANFRTPGASSPAFSSPPRVPSPDGEDERLEPSPS